MDCMPNDKLSQTFNAWLMKQYLYRQISTYSNAYFPRMMFRIVQKKTLFSFVDDILKTFQQNKY